MTDTCTQCPKCGYQPPAPLPSSASCPNCGIYFFKWVKPIAAPIHHNIKETPGSGDVGFLASLLLPLEKMDSVSFYGRSISLALLAVWSWFLFGYDHRTGEIGMSFMHNILLPIHEAGHVIFRPLGEFMMILGGSLFQFALPVAIGIAFIVKQHDNFGASVALWWGGVSLVDLSPYIYDALHPQLVLLGGGTGSNDGPHDWIYLLTMLNQLDNARRWGTFIHVSGGLVMLLMLVWGAFLMLQQHKLLDESI